MTPVIWTLQMDGWLPTPVNRLLGGHWGKAHRLKERDKEVIANAVLAYGVPAATGRRRVSLQVVLAPGKRAPDPDALFKSLLDALTACAALKDDNRQGVVLGPVRFCRGEAAATYVTIEEVP